MLFEKGIERSAILLESAEKLRTLISSFWRVYFFFDRQVLTQDFLMGWIWRIADVWLHYFCTLVLKPEEEYSLNFHTIVDCLKSRWFSSFMQFREVNLKVGFSQQRPKASLHLSKLLSQYWNLKKSESMINSSNFSRDFSNIF